MAPPRLPQSAYIPDIDDDLKKIIDANMDQAPARRRARDAFKHIQLSIDHCLFKMPSQGLKMNEVTVIYMKWSNLPLKSNLHGYFCATSSASGKGRARMYEVNSRGLEIFSKSWAPETSPPKALICFCHGFGDTCTFFFEGIARKLASSGYGVFAMDYPGFGLSDGLHGYIPSFDQLVDDVIEHYSRVKDNPELRTLPSFLFGQSMGGAVALKVHLKQPNAWDGAILVAPMCKIADDVYPPWIVTQILIGVAKFLPQAKLVPDKDLADMAFREKKELTAYNIIAYKDKARLGTALELLNTTQEIERRLEEVSLPLLILHGEADVVTDPSVSKSLHEKASSKDKMLTLYKDAYHALLEGEPDEVIFRVLNDIITWLDDHSTKNDTPLS